MKTPLPKLACLFTLMLAASLCDSPALLYAYDGFNYTAGANVTGQNGGAGNWSGTWVGPTSTTVATPGLVYTGLTTTGNSAFDSNTAGQGNVRSWTGLNSSSGSELWFSALVNSPGTGSDLRLFALTTTGMVPGGGNGIGFSLSNLTVRAQLDGAVSANITTLTANTTYLLVARLSFFDTPASDQLTVWVNPTIGTTVPTGGTTMTGSFDSYVSAPVAGFRGGSAWSGKIDEVRLGTTYADVVTVPEPGAIALLLGGGLGAFFQNRRRRRSNA